LQIKAEQKATLEKIIEQAQEQQRLLSKQQTELEAKQAKTKTDSPHKTSEKDQKELERSLTRTFAQYVPNKVAKLGPELSHEDHKKCSKEIVHLLVTKETREGHVVKDPTKLSEEKKKKVYAFVKLYVEKVVAKKRAKKSDKRELETTTTGDPDPENSSKRIKYQEIVLSDDD
jgi:hypothetical protein